MTDKPEDRDPLDLRPCECDGPGISQGRHGDLRSRSWCIACGGLLLEAHDRPCGECQHYKAWSAHGRTGRCDHPAHSLMGVTQDMLVTYWVRPDAARHREGLCFQSRHSPDLFAAASPQTPPAQGVVADPPTVL